MRHWAAGTLAGVGVSFVVGGKRANTLMCLLFAIKACDWREAVAMKGARAFCGLRMIWFVIKKKKKPLIRGDGALGRDLPGDAATALRETTHSGCTF